MTWRIFELVQHCSVLPSRARIKLLCRTCGTLHSFFFFFFVPHFMILSASLLALCSLTLCRAKLRAHSQQSSQRKVLKRSNGLNVPSSAVPTFIQLSENHFSCVRHALFVFGRRPASDRSGSAGRPTSTRVAA